jgi:3-hydroxy-9,10-secoandrosta-1,3,5(10)-triene-9,17-dione monooxygenase
MSSAELSKTEISPPEPNLTPTEMLRRAQNMRVVLRERQPLCEKLGRIPDETNEDFLRAGFYRIVQPRCFGGYEFSVPDFIRVMTEVSRGCPESGWVLTLTAGHPEAFISGFSDQAQREVYGEVGDCRAPGVFLPGGTAIPIPGGFQIKGAWDYSSGCDIATHFLGGMIALDAQSHKPDCYVYALFDRKDFHIVDNWDVIGMQGTGSRRVVVEEMTLPAHRVLKFGDAELKTFFEQPGRALHKNPMYHGPILLFLYCELTSVAVGTARGALDVYEQILRERKMNIPPFTPRTEMGEFQHHFGHAQGLIDTAEAALLQLGSNYMEMSERIVHGMNPTLEEQRRFQRVAQQCVELAWNAVDLMFRTAGSSAAKKTSALARYFRNLAVIRTHTTMQIDHTSTNVGRLHFGVPPLSSF